MASVAEDLAALVETTRHAQRQHSEPSDRSAMASPSPPPPPPPIADVSMPPLFDPPPPPPVDLFIADALFRAPAQRPPPAHAAAISDSELAALHEQQQARFQQKDAERSHPPVVSGSAAVSAASAIGRRPSLMAKAGTANRRTSIEPIAAPGDSASANGPSIYGLFSSLVPLLSSSRAIGEFRASLQRLADFQARDQMSGLFDGLMSARAAAAQPGQQGAQARQIASLTDQLKEDQKLIGQASLVQRQLSNKVAQLEQQIAQLTAAAAINAANAAAAAGNAGVARGALSKKAVSDSPAIHLSLGVQSFPHPKEKGKNKPNASVGDKSLVEETASIDVHGSSIGDSISPSIAGAVFPLGCPRFNFGLEQEFAPVHQLAFMQANWSEY